MSIQQDIKDFPLLPGLIPYDEPHKKLCELLLSGKTPLRDAASFFWIPGLGFHQNLYFSTLQWVSYRACGSNTLAIKRDLQDALENTEIDFSPADLKIPVATLYVALPGSPRKVWGGQKGEWRTLGGAFVSFSKGKRSTYNASTDTGVEKTSQLDPNLDLGGISILLWGIGKDLEEEASFWISLDLSDMLLRGESYESYINRILNEEPDAAKSLEKFCGIFAIPQTPSSVAGVWFQVKEEARKSLQTILNLMAFLPSTSFTFQVEEETKKLDEKREALAASMERKKSAKKIRRALAQYDRLPQERIILVGTEEELPPLRPPITRGYWTPRRNSLAKELTPLIRKRSEMEKSVASLKLELQEAKEVKVVAEKTLRMMALEDSLEGLESAISFLTKEITQKLMWVKPTSQGAEPPLPGKPSQEATTP